MRLMVGIGAVVMMLACAKAENPNGSPDPGQTAKGIPPSVQRQTPRLPELDAFEKRVKEYLELHDKLEKTMPALPKEADPKQIDTHQRALADLVRRDRATAKRGDLFTPDVEKIIRAELTQVFGGRDGKSLKASIMDENPVGVKLAVNGRYPDEVPMSTMPPQVLAVLPKLPVEIEYRFVGDRLILLDVHAHIVMDYIDRALPA